MTTESNYSIMQNYNTRITLQFNAELEYNQSIMQSYTRIKPQYNAELQFNTGWRNSTAALQVL